MTAARTVGWLGLNLVLTTAVLTTAVAAVETSHRCRDLYSGLQRLQTAQWNMQEQWGRLLLEHGTWAAHHRVERLARDELDMRLPLAAEIEVVAR